MGGPLKMPGQRTGVALRRLTRGGKLKTERVGGIRDAVS
jgi:hypothetical protein